MNTHSFVRLILWRDIRHLRLLLFFLLATFAATLLIGVSPNRELDYLSALTWLTNLLLVLLTIRVIRADPPNRQIRLLSGPPVPWIALPLAKGLFIALALVLPVWAVRDILVQQVGMLMRPWDHVALLIDIATTYGWLLGGTILIALFIRRTWLILILLVLAYLPLQILSYYANNFWYSPAKDPNDPNLFLLLQCREFIQEWGIALTVIVTALVRYQTRQWLLPVVVAVVCLAVTLALSPIWPFNFVSTFANQTTALGHEPWQHIKMTTVADQNPPFRSSSWPSEDTGILYHSVQVDGIAPPYYAEPIDYNAVATLHSGEKIVFHNKDFNSSIGDSWMRDNLIPSLVGLIDSKSLGGPWEQKDVEFFAFHPSRFHNQDLKGVTIKGTLTLQIWRTFVLGTIPFAERSGLPIQRGRIQIQNIGHSGGLFANLTLWQLPLTLSNDQIMPWYTGAPYSVSVYNLAKDDQLEVADSKGMDYAEGTDSRITSGGDTFITTVHTRYNFKMSEQDGTVPSDEWLRGAKMSFIATEKVGKIEIPYEIDNVDLPQ